MYTSSRVAFVIGLTPSTTAAYSTLLSSFIFAIISDTAVFSKGNIITEVDIFITSGPGLVPAVSRLTVKPDVFAVAIGLPPFTASITVITFAKAVAEVYAPSPAITTAVLVAIILALSPAITVPIRTALSAPCSGSDVTPLTSYQNATLPTSSCKIKYFPSMLNGFEPATNIVAVNVAPKLPTVGVPNEP